MRREICKSGRTEIYALWFMTLRFVIYSSSKIYCPRRDFAQKAKFRGGSLVSRAYIKKKYLQLRYTVIQSI